MKKLLFTMMFSIVISGAAYAGGSAITDLKANASPAALDNVSFETPKVTKCETESELSKLKAETGAEGSTPYEVLKNLFKMGTPAVEEDLAGYHSGRAALSYARDEFRPAYLYGVRLSTSSGGGPLAQNKSGFYVLSSYLDPGLPGDYDHAVPASTVSTLNADIRDLGWIVSFPAAEGLVTSPGKAKFVIQYRKIKGYIFVRNASYDANWELYDGFYSYYFRDAIPPASK